MREAFEAQLNNATIQPRDGDYLAGRTANEVIESILMLGVSRETAEEVIAERIIDWRVHANQKQLYFFELLEKEKRLVVHDVWEAEIDSLAEEWEIQQCPPPGQYLPYLKRKQ